MTVQPASPAPGSAFFRPGTGPNDPPRQVPNPVRDEGHRIQEQCQVCGQWDDHPKHSHGDPQTGWTVRHLDCCAAAGCPNAGHPYQAEQACGELHAASGHKHGPELIAWLTGKEGKAHTAKLNRLAEARRTVDVARAGAEIHQQMADENTAHVERSKQLLAEAEKTVKELSGK